MYPDQIAPEEPKRKTKSWHWDQAEHYLQMAADSAGPATTPASQYSEWCQRQAQAHATLATGKS